MRNVLISLATTALLAGLSHAAPPVSASDGTTLGSAQFSIDLDSRTLIVTADPETNETVRRVIEQLDKPVPQALIKVLFLEVLLDDEVDVGADIENRRTSGDGNGSIIQTMFGAGGFVEGGTATILEHDLSLTLSALSEVTRMEVLSRPSIMARNNQEATITIGSEVPFIRNSQVTDDGRVLNTVEYEDIGIILTVTPHISDDGMVELDVAPEISTLTGETVRISDQVVAPTFAKRSAETHVVVPAGKTVVIGGLMENKDTEIVRKVPLLGDIPGIGGLFRRKTKDKQKTELLIFLTPHVVANAAEAQKLSKDERDSTLLIPRRIAPHDLKKYLPGLDD